LHLPNHANRILTHVNHGSTLRSQALIHHSLGHLRPPLQTERAIRPERRLHFVVRFAAFETPFVRESGETNFRLLRRNRQRQRRRRSSRQSSGHNPPSATALQPHANGNLQLLAPLATGMEKRNRFGHGGTTRRVRRFRLLLRWLCWRRVGLSGGKLSWLHDL